MIWGTDRPVTFALLMGAIAAATSYLLVCADWILGWRIPAPKLASGFDLSAFAGVPWSVQATLVALVYPLVLSFIALTLQRKAHSTVSLRVYILDSAVVPAGASSIGLLIALGVEYFITPYKTDELMVSLMAPLLAASGIWLLFNVLLTGFFLGRTLRFVQEEDQKHAFSRVAVDVALHAELVSAVKKHVYLNAPQSAWGLPAFNVEGTHPQVLTFQLRKGRTQVKRTLRGGVVLHDVHLRLLRLVVKSWSRRAVRKAQATPQWKKPTLIFRAQIGAGALGEVVLCTVDEGPALNRLERFLVRTSFIYGPAASLSLSTKKMLDELVGGVEAATEQHRFGAAHEELKEVFRLHKTLLLAGVSHVQAIGRNAATIGRSPSSWGNSSFNQEWLEPYREGAQIAVNCLEDDERLFRTLSNITAGIASQVGSRPEQLLIDAQLVSTNLAYQLSAWWTRKADASLTPGATSFSGVLPTKEHKVYERAIVGFIGGWGQFRVRLDVAESNGDAEAWYCHTGRAIAYAAHIDNTVRLLFAAVSRGDETASVWLVDCFLKWWGNREFELVCPQLLEDFRLRDVSLHLAQMDWASAQQDMWDGAESITLDFAVAALNLAIRKYWESVRLYVILVLIQTAGAVPSAQSRELRLASALIQGSPLHAGGSVKVWRLDSVDDVLRAALGTLYGVNTPLVRIDAIAESLDRGAGDIVVPGWLYRWSGSANHFESLKRPLEILLVALAGARGSGVRQSKQLIENWWRDLNKLQEVKSYCNNLREHLGSQDFDSAEAAVQAVQVHLNKSFPIPSGRSTVAEAFGTLQRVATHERHISLKALQLDLAKIHKMARSLGSSAFVVAKYSPPVREVLYASLPSAPHHQYQFDDHREHYLRGLDSNHDRGLVPLLGAELRRISLSMGFEALVRELGLTPVSAPAEDASDDISSDDKRAFIAAVASQCSALAATGETPVIVAGNSPSGQLLSAHEWGPEEWRCHPPSGVAIVPSHLDDGLHTLSRVNGVAAYSLETPDEGCFVVPGRLLRSLTVSGTSPESALSIEWRELNEEQLRFTLTWRASFIGGRQRGM
ncbi:hypothetical protein EAH83_11030 [Variovorax ginsengisoli]|uniref:Uncharacterized protein n=1 Tax=Variovorax guangxiensis TaxID=1775474 RepID=A0A502DUR3_9BURK|nr:hypothetical protein EAH83_11030 [Variovorax ginsengisoli]TPG29208.1 hypothetical protein EAH82_10690 [Variovorax guangxiensis]